jgi:hypothetical protein
MKCPIYRQNYFQPIQFSGYTLKKAYTVFHSQSAFKAVIKFRFNKKIQIA